MEKTIPHKAIEVNHAGLAVECGTLDILLEALQLHDVLLIPLERTLQHGSQVLKQFLLHVTAHPYRHAPVYYTGFLIAELLGIGHTASLLHPYQALSIRPEEALGLVKTLQEHAMTVLVARLEASPHVSRVIKPARYTLPSEWVWNARCQDLVYRDGQWQWRGGEEASND